GTPPIFLVGTQGERRANSITFTEGIFNPSVLTDTSPIFCDAKHPVRLRGTAGERIEKQPFSPCCFVTLRNATRYGKGGVWE
ncbi:MAG TPA: hypothetical protein DDY40_01815, partial [Barnesiella intestinihominis]|nr:hypothetical protein [Barnesiella intestinihominis]